MAVGRGPSGPASVATSAAVRGQEPTTIRSSISSQLSVHRHWSAEPYG